jgi:hypothetical protein
VRDYPAFVEAFARADASNAYLAAYAAFVRAQRDVIAAGVRATEAGIDDDQLARARNLIDKAAER